MQSLNKLPVRQIIQAILAVAILVFIVMAASKLVDQVEVMPDLLSFGFISAAVLAVVYRIVNAYGWSIVLAAQGDNVDGVQATRIWLISESRRWLPGGIWGYASRATMASDMGVPTTRASISMILEMLLIIIAAGFVSVPGAVLHWSKVADAITQFLAGVPLFALAIGTGACLVVGYLIRKPFMKKVKSFTGKFSSLKEMKIVKSQLLLALVFFVAMNVLNGSVGICLLYSLGVDEYPPASVVIAATAIAWLVGLFAIYSPGGIIVREGAFGVLLLPWMPYTTAFTLAILMRLLQVFAELVGLAAILGFDAWRRWHPKKSQSVSSARH
ncbi:MAG: lysylphosphatidylglycerol synthase transmembrane domain-containing protein [Planctomycetota bacterium]